MSISADGLEVDGLEADGLEVDSLEARIAASFDVLLQTLDFEVVGEDRFRAPCESKRFPSIFGGQLLCQALYAAGTTVTGQSPDSLHAYFASAGTTADPVEISVDRVRDGRSMSLRRVTISQHGHPLLVAMAAFHDNPLDPYKQVGEPRDIPPPLELPTLQQWMERAPEHFRRNVGGFVDPPPPIEMRLVEPPTFAGGPHADSTRCHWLRAPRSVGDDELVNASLLAYASDYLMVDSVFRTHPNVVWDFGVRGASLDHAIWFHRPVRFDRWHQYSQQTTVVGGHRGLASGELYDDAGRLVATVAQEVLVRPQSPR